MANRDIVVVGASAGGMDALQKLVAVLPKDLPAALFVVWHLSPGVRSVLPNVLSRSGPLPAQHPNDGDPIEPGRIYIAPPDHHMLVERDYIRVTKGPKENRFRPAVDPLFRSAAYVFGARTVGVVLSGALDDGTAGLWTIKLRGGTTVVQDPADAMHRSMPLNALQNVSIDHKLPAGKIGELILTLSRQRAGPDVIIPEHERQKLEREIQIAGEAEALEQRMDTFGELTSFTCPECRGVLTMLHDGKLVRFRCHTGHAYSANSLLSGATEQAEDRLWDAVRAIDEAVLLLTKLGEENVKAGNTRIAEQCFDKAREAHDRAAPIREAAMKTEKLSDESLREHLEEPQLVEKAG
jgi:two-component system chemotaxis response regulator CheB